MIKNAKISIKISMIVMVMSFVAIVVAAIGAYSLSVYNTETNNIKMSSERAVLGERVNGLVYAVVMDSRGIYMSQTPEDIEKYGKPLLENLAKIADFLGKWEKILPAEQRDEFTALEADAKKFIEYRTELVRLGREGGSELARPYGDNENNRNNRKALNEKVKSFAEINNKDIAAKTKI